MNLHIQKVADKMDGRWGVGHTKWGRARGFETASKNHFLAASVALCASPRQLAFDF
jgi:hypothetical protein